MILSGSCCKVLLPVRDISCSNKMEQSADGVSSKLDSSAQVFRKVDGGGTMAADVFK